MKVVFVVSVVFGKEYGAARVRCRRAATSVDMCAKRIVNIRREIILWFAIVMFSVGDVNASLSKENVDCKYCRSASITGC